MKPSESAPKDQVQGEGDYVSARRYQQDQHAFAQKADEVSRKAHEAEAALEGPEGQELERARAEAAKGHPRKS